MNVLAFLLLGLAVFVVLGALFAWWSFSRVRQEEKRADEHYQRRVEEMERHKWY